jgi:hypothetical protein
VDPEYVEVGPAGGGVPASPAPLSPSSDEDESESEADEDEVEDEDRRDAVFDDLDEWLP